MNFLIFLNLYFIPKLTIFPLWGLGVRGLLFLPLWGLGSFFLFAQPTKNPPTKNPPKKTLTPAEIKQNIEKAKKLNDQAKTLLFKKNPQKAYPLLLEGANLGYSDAQYGLASLYATGVTGALPQSDSLAHEWCKKSALQGHVSAQFRLSYDYMMGRGTKKDEKKAFEWTKKCAEKNDFDAIFNLIGFYKEGYGVKANEQEATQWAIKLASMTRTGSLEKNGQISAIRYHLGIIYRKGEGAILPNQVESYKWFLLANEFKNGFMTGTQQKIVTQIKELEAILSPDDLIKAQELAEKQINQKLMNVQNKHKVEY